MFLPFGTLRGVFVRFSAGHRFTQEDGFKPRTDGDAHLEHFAGVFTRGARPCPHAGEVFAPPRRRLAPGLVKVQCP